MSTRASRLLFWLPRILGIAYALFLSLLALDAFEGDRSTLEKLGAFLIHLVPTFLVLVVLVAAWRWEWVGAVLFFGLAVLYVVIAWGMFDVETYLIVAGPIVLIAVLFLLGWRARLGGRS